MRRVVALAALSVVVLAGLWVHAWLPDSAASDIAGDALYAWAAALAVVVVAPRLRPVVAGAIAFAWCAAIELLQLTPLPGVAASVFSPAMLVLGTVFDVRDLVVYALGVAVATIVDVLVSRRIGR